MNTYIAILRGINVGGKRTIKMAVLKLMFEQLGFTQVSTYIQSGNVFFKAQKALRNNELETQIEQAIHDHFGYEVPVIIRDSKEMETIVSNNPFYKEENEINPLHCTFLEHEPNKESLKKVKSYTFPPDEFVIKGKEVFIHCKGKYHQSKLSNAFFEKKLGVKATTRNWKTTLRLYEKSQAM